MISIKVQFVMKYIAETSFNTDILTLRIGIEHIFFGIVPQRVVYKQGYIILIDLKQNESQF